MEYVSRRRFPRKPSTLKGIHLPPSDILRRLYCTSRPSWWNHRCPRRTNGRPLKRDEERKKNAIDFCNWIPGKMSKRTFCSERKNSPFYIFTLSRACKFSPWRYLVCDRDNFGEAIHLIVHCCSDCDRSSIAILLERTIERVSFIVSHCGDHLSALVSNFICNSFYSISNIFSSRNITCRKYEY